MMTACAELESVYGIWLYEMSQSNAEESLREGGCKRKASVPLSKAVLATLLCSPVEAERRESLEVQVLPSKV